MKDQGMNPGVPTSNEAQTRPRLETFCKEGR